MSFNVNEIKTAAFTDATSGQNPEQEEVISPAMLAMQELQETAGSAIYETLEEMGMVLSGKLWKEKNQTGVETQERRQQALLRLVKQMQENTGTVVCLSSAQNSDCPELQSARQILAISIALTASGITRKKKRALKSRLDALTTEEGWELAVFSLIELNTVNASMLASLKHLMQQALDEDEMSLSQWFKRMANWPDRRARVRILLRTMAFELSVCVEASQQRLAAVLARLRRLLLFLNLENECRREELICQLAAGVLLPLLLDIIGERWLFSDWLLDKLTPLVASPRMLNRLLQQLDALFTLLPDRCFNDDDQRLQILETLRELKGIQVLP